MRNIDYAVPTYLLDLNQHYGIEKHYYVQRRLVSLFKTPVVYQHNILIVIPIPRGIRKEFIICQSIRRILSYPIEICLWNALFKGENPLLIWNGTASIKIWLEYFTEFIATSTRNLINFQAYLSFRRLYKTCTLKKSLDVPIYETFSSQYD